MDDATLAAIREQHVVSRWLRHDGSGICSRCRRAWPCDAVRLLADMDRLRAMLTPERLAAALCSTAHRPDSSEPDWCPCPQHGEMASRILAALEADR